MKDTPEKRDQLRTAIWAGEQAERLLKELDPKFVELKERYRSNLVNCVRTHAEDREIVLAASRVAALEDLYEEFYQTAVTGRRAQAAATKLESEATS